METQVTTPTKSLVSSPIGEKELVCLWITIQKMPTITLHLAFLNLNFFSLTLIYFDLLEFVFVFWDLFSLTLSCFCFLGIDFAFWELSSFSENRFR